MNTYILADNQELTRLAIEHIASQQPNSVTKEASNMTELMELLNLYRRAVVVLDYTLFDFESVDQLLILSERYPDVTWVLLSAELSTAFLRKVIYSSNLFSIVFKDHAVKDIRHAMLTAAQGKRYISQHIIEAILSQSEEERPIQLTHTEIEVLRGITQGKTTKEIAAERFSSIHTINTHKKNIFRKLQVNTAHEAIKYALRAGLVDQSEFYI